MIPITFNRENKMKTVMLFLAVGLLARAAVAQELSWSELARRSEHWPAQCTIKKAMKFRSGESVAAGQKLDVLEIRTDQIALGTTDGKTSFTTKPEDTDALAVAREAWNKLTPAQRELTYAALLRRPDLWPYRVTGREAFDLGGPSKIPKGESLILIGAEGSELLVGYVKLNTSFTVRPQQTDLIFQARKFVEAKEGAPGRLLEELQGKLLEPTSGKPAALPANAAPRYLVFYRGAGWCPPCRQFSPTLLKTYKELKPQYPDFELIFLSDDHSISDLQKYVKEEGFPWLAVPQTRLKELQIVSPALGRSIPQLLVMDRHGKVVLDSIQMDRAVALKRLEALLKQPLAQK
jgi:thiol-disulfide isomerase/thioredoxin